MIRSVNTLALQSYLALHFKGRLTFDLHHGWWEAAQWCIENLGENALAYDSENEMYLHTVEGRWTRNGSYFYFKTEADAIVCKIAITKEK